MLEVCTCDSLVEKARFRFDLQELSSSNLPFVARIIEKSALPQFVQHLQQNGLYSAQNSAYKEYHSTETLLVKVYSDVMNSMDRQQVTILVLLDLSAAFDTVDLKILSVIFQQRFNISGTVRSWFFFLSERQRTENYYKGCLFRDL